MFSRQTLGSLISLGLFLDTEIPDFSFLSLIASSITLKTASNAPLLLTFLYSFRIRNLNALAYSDKKWYLCIGNGRKGSISRMSDECLMKQETVFSYCYDCQAVMRKFTLAVESLKWEISDEAVSVITMFAIYNSHVPTSQAFQPYGVWFLRLYSNVLELLLLLFLSYP